MVDYMYRLFLLALILWAWPIAHANACDPPQTLISSTTNTSSRGSAWGMSCNALNGGSIYYYDKEISTFGFICVREGYPRAI